MRASAPGRDLCPRPGAEAFFAEAVDAVAPGADVVTAGGRLDADLLLAGYRAGVFAMPVRAGRGSVLAWFAPDPRGVLLPGAVHESRSLRRSSRSMEIRVDTAFEAVVAGCADPRREGAWISAGYRRAYRRLHAAGWAHSVECWQGGSLVGGLFGVSVGGLFAAESKFHVVTDASKAAVVALGRLLAADGDVRRVVDVQWRTEHLATLGVVDVPRGSYRHLLREALGAPPPACFSAGAPAAR